jgi:hypothetical protein
MWYDIGGKIKILAKIVFWVGIVGSIIIGLVYSLEHQSDHFLIFVGVVLIFVGIFISLVSSWLIYGFGELIEKTAEIAYNIKIANDTTRQIAENTSKTVFTGSQPAAPSYMPSNELPDL